MSPSTRLVLAAAAALVQPSAAWVPTERFGNAPSNFDLGHTKLVFTPNSDHTDYGICTSYTAELPFAIDVADSPAVELVCVCANAGDECHQNPNAIPGVCYDDDHGVLPMTTPFPYYGRTYGEIYVNVNGQITFGTGSTDWSESLAAHLTVPGLAVFFDDLMTKHNPEINGWTNYFRSIDDAGTVYHRALTASESSAGGVVVTWMRVAGYVQRALVVLLPLLLPLPLPLTCCYSYHSPRLSRYLDAGNVGTQDVLDTNLNTFQAVLEYDGTITMAYELIALPDAIVGLSDGTCAVACCVVARWRRRRPPRPFFKPPRSPSRHGSQPVLREHRLQRLQVLDRPLRGAAAAVHPARPRRRGGLQGRGGRAGRRGGRGAGAGGQRRDDVRDREPRPGAAAEHERDRGARCGLFSHQHGAGGGRRRAGLAVTVRAPGRRTGGERRLVRADGSGQHLGRLARGLLGRLL